MSPLTLVLMLSVSFGVAFTTASSRECPTYWTSYGSYCYRFYGRPQTWHLAEGHCRRSYPGKTPHLVSIHSYGENAFIKNLLETTRGDDNGRYWIGYNDLHWTQYFIWSDGSSRNYQNWLPGEPNNDNKGREDCGEIYKAGGKVGWNDALCDNWKKYVCKMQK